ncbi:MAG TPA: sigma 54-interacting transcriptional regulator [Kofleriaceae bacterium]
MRRSSAGSGSADCSTSTIVALHELAIDIWHRTRSRRRRRRYARRVSAIDDRTTRRKPPVAPKPKPARRAAMTVLWHADPERVGDVAGIEGPMAVSRVEPELGPPGRQTRGPLGDRHLSRRPLLRLVPRADRLVIARTEAAGEIAVDGLALTGDVTVDPGALARGVVIEIDGRVVLLAHLRAAGRAASADHGLAGAGDAIDRVRDAIAAAATADAAVLVRGETGTGKELVARAVHAASARCDAPFVAVNLAALPSSVAVAQLFGHRGAGARSASAGYFRAAAGGTLFLDEVGACALDVQAMLLRALEQREIQPIGAPVPEPVDVRIIAATDANLELAARGGRFREALLQRLSGIAIDVPALRDRRDDVARLLVRFLGEELAALGASPRLRPRTADEPLWLPAAFVAAACRQPWPGNVRQLRNACRRIAAAHHADDAIALESLVEQLERRDSPEAPAETATIDDERAVAALAANGWRTGKTAAELGISRTTLYAIMERSGKATTARELNREQIRAAGERAGGDVAQMAADLRVSVRALKLRIRELRLP